MRPNPVRLAQAATKYLTPGNPTGLTGLFTHPSPRPALLALYYRTLEKLDEIPGSSAYRAAAEALTKQRLSIVESVKPAGYDEWAAKAKEILDADSGLFARNAGSSTSGSIGSGSTPGRIDDSSAVNAVNSTSGLTQQFGGGRFQRHLFENGKKVIVTERLIPAHRGETAIEWNRHERQDPVESEPEGGRMDSLHARTVLAARDEMPAEERDWKPEPALDAAQVADIEQQIGAGLIEEVIQVAEGELTVVEEIIRSQAWEEPEEKAPEGQWLYAERDRHTGTTQAPPTGY